MYICAPLIQAKEFMHFISLFHERTNMQQKQQEKTTVTRKEKNGKIPLIFWRAWRHEEWNQGNISSVPHDVLRIALFLRTGRVPRSLIWHITDCLIKNAILMTEITFYSYWCLMNKINYKIDKNPDVLFYDWFYQKKKPFPHHPVIDRKGIPAETSTHNCQILSFITLG